MDELDKVRRTKRLFSSTGYLFDIAIAFLLIASTAFLLINETKLAVYLIVSSALAVLCVVSLRKAVPVYRVPLPLMNDGGERVHNGETYFIKGSHYSQFYHFLSHLLLSFSLLVFGYLFFVFAEFDSMVGLEQLSFIILFSFNFALLVIGGLLVKASQKNLSIYIRHKKGLI